MPEVRMLTPHGLVFTNFPDQRCSIAGHRALIPIAPDLFPVYGCTFTPIEFDGMPFVTVTKLYAPAGIVGKSKWV